MNIVLYVLSRKSDKKVTYGIGQRGAPIIMVFTEDGMQDYSLKDIDELYDLVMIKDNVDPATMIKAAMKA